MRRTALALAALALAAGPLAGVSSAGCVEDYLSVDDGGDPVVTIHPDGSITISPGNAVSSTTREVRRARTLADCVL